MMHVFFLTAAAADAVAIAQRHSALLDSLGLASAVAVVQEEGAAPADAPSAAAAVPAQGSGDGAAAVKRIQRRLAVAAEDAKRRKTAIAELARRNQSQRAQLAELHAQIGVALADTAAANEEIAQIRAQAGIEDTAALEGVALEGDAAVEPAAGGESPPPHCLDSRRYGVIVQLIPSTFDRDEVGRLAHNAGAPRPQRAEFMKRLVDRTQQVLYSYDAKADAVKARAALHNFTVGDCPPLRAFYQPA